MSQILDTLKAQLATWYDYGHISSVLSWDQETYMPEAAASERADQLALIAEQMQAVLSSDELKTTLSKWIDLETGKIKIGASIEEAAALKKTYKRWKDANCLPPDFVSRWAKTTSKAQFHWQSARTENNFSAFAPHLQTIIDMIKERANYIDPKKNAYDLCLDEYEPGLSVADCNQFFASLKAPLVDLLQEMTEKTASFPTLTGVKVPIQSQWEFGMTIAHDIGFDFKRGRQDKSTHPFTLDMGRNDVRITTRLKEDDFTEAFSSTIHELGHALYQQGLPEAWQGIAVGESVSLGIHESQSRFWENMIAKRPSFWSHYFPQLQSKCPEAFSNWTQNAFIQSLHHVKPGLIRVEADEISYCLHIMLRFDCERALILDGLDVKDLPEFWKQKMQDYLGITPDTDANGVLQDVHWSAGLFGYFPTYAIGSVVAAQLWDALAHTHPKIEEEIAAGNFKTVLTWLQESIHQKGSLYEPKALVKNSTGSDIDTAPFLQYLSQKYRAL